MLFQQLGSTQFFQWWMKRVHSVGMREKKVWNAVEVCDIRRECGCEKLWVCIYTGALALPPDSKFQITHLARKPCLLFTTATYGPNQFLVTFLCSTVRIFSAHGKRCFEVNMTLKIIKLDPLSDYKSTTTCRMNCSCCKIGWRYCTCVCGLCDGGRVTHGRSPDGNKQM